MSSKPGLAAIGIDLGTTFSVAAVYHNNKTEVIPDRNGKRTIPSCVFYSPNSATILVGKDAEKEGAKYPQNLLFDMKRIIGRKYSDAYVQQFINSKEYQFKIVEGADNRAEIELEHNKQTIRKTPEEVCSEIIKYLREAATDFLGKEVTKAVISVPAYFSMAQKKATKKAAEIAKLTVERLITEPVAAAVCYAQERLDHPATLLVFDFGGGTLDISIIKMSPAPAIGIDLGTTFSVAAVYRSGKVKVIPNKEGNRLTPSYIFYHPDSLKVSVGTTADDRGRTKIDNFLFDIKRLIGRKYDDVYVQQLKKTDEYKYNIIKGDKNNAEIELLYDGVKVTKSPEEASSEIIKYIRECANEYLGADITEAVISIPAHFSIAQRKATHDAAELAGFKVLKLITEPVAAAIHFAEDRLDTNSTLLVFDFGGGTLDVSIICVSGKKFEVKSVKGDTFLGGRDFDEILLQYFKEKITAEFGSKIFDRRLSRRVKDYCIYLKVKLSTEQTYEMPPIECIGGNENFNFIMSLSREKFECLTNNLFDKALNLVKTCLKESEMSKDDITDVVLVGGCTRIPKVRKMLETFFNKNKIRTDLNPDEAVAIGAAIQAAFIKEKYQELEKYKVTEVTPLSLGLGLDGDLMEVAIRRNTPLPYKSLPIETITIENNQKSCRFKIYEGERKNCKYNNFLGSFDIENLPPGKSGEVKFEVFFILNDNGILEVKATETYTGENNNLVVTMGEFRLCDNTIRSSIEDAAKNKTQDDIFEKFILFKWKVRKVCYHILYDLEKISSAKDRNFVKLKCKELKDTLEQLTFTQIEILKNKYKLFKAAVKGILAVNNIQIIYFDEEDSFTNVMELVRLSLTASSDVGNTISNRQLVEPKYELVRK